VLALSFLLTVLQQNMDDISEEVPMDLDYDAASKRGGQEPRVCILNRSDVVGGSIGQDFRSGGKVLQIETQPNGSQVIWPPGKGPRRASTTSNATGAKEQTATTQEFGTGSGSTVICNEGSVYGGHAGQKF